LNAGGLILQLGTSDAVLKGGVHTIMPDLTESLRTFGCIPVRLRDSLQLIDIVQGCSVDGILCDQEAMSLKGLAVVTQLRKRSPAPPLLVITGPLNKRISMEIFGTGAKDFITKPLNNKELREKCTRLFKTEAPHC
jgi:DNA-binding response OmpR family regulator